MMSYSIPSMKFKNIVTPPYQKKNQTKMKQMNKVNLKGTSLYSRKKCK